MTNSDFIFLLVCVISIILTLYKSDIQTLLLNIKLYLLFTILFILLKNNIIKIENNPLILFSLINFFLIIYKLFLSDYYFIPIEFVNENYQSQFLLRPTGLFLVPHVSSAFSAIICIGCFMQKRYTLFIINFLATMFTFSATAFVSLVIALLFMRNKISRLLFYISLTIMLPLVIIFREDIIHFLSISSYTRYYSLEMILEQFAHPIYYSQLFNFFPSNLDDIMEYTEIYFKMLGSEVGFVRTSIQIGFLYLLVSLLKVTHYFKYYSIFIIITFFHYTYIYSFPLILLALFYYEKNICCYTDDR